MHTHTRFTRQQMLYGRGYFGGLKYKFKKNVMNEYEKDEKKW